MKKIMLIVFVATFSLSCKNEMKKIKNRLWIGKVNLNNNVSRRVVMNFSNDTLYVYSNAIFGSKRDTLFIRRENNDSLFLYSKNDSIKFSYSSHRIGLDNFLELSSNDITLSLKESDKQLSDYDVLSFYKNIDVPKNSYMYIDNTYKGKIYRLGDNKELADLKFEIRADSLLMYSNAIFGAKNDTLLLRDFDESIPSFTYYNNDNEKFKLDIGYDKELDLLYFKNKDFAIFFSKYDKNIFKGNELSYYKNKNVPREPYLYFDGSYKGYVEYESSFRDFYMQSYNLGGGRTKIKLVFIDDEKLKYYETSFVKSAIEGVKPEILHYRIKNETLHIFGEKGSLEFKIINEGAELVYQDDEKNIILRKEY